jgi:hypothetical protein
MYCRIGIQQAAPGEQSARLVPSNVAEKNSQSNAFGNNKTKSEKRAKVTTQSNHELNRLRFIHSTTRLALNGITFCDLASIGLPVGIR